MNKLISKASDAYQDEPEVFYRITKSISQNSEFLLVQKQLESTVKMQMDNNRLLMTDILHMIVICDNLAKNAISINHFFENEYVESLKTIKKYSKKK